MTDKCDGRVSLNYSYSYQKPWPIGYPQPPFLQISLNPGSTSENSISFNLDTISYSNNSEAELTVNSVSVFSANTELVAATGSCKFQGLNTSQPEFLCNAKSKEAVPRIFAASFTYDESRAPEVFRDHGDALSRMNSVKSTDFRDFVVFAKKLFENPDGLCANPVNQSKDICAKIVDRSGAQKYPTRKSNNVAIPKNTEWPLYLSKTRLSIRNDYDAKRQCPIVCSSVKAGRATGRWERRPLQVIMGNEYQGLIGYIDSACECLIK